MRSSGEAQATRGRTIIFLTLPMDRRQSPSATAIPGGWRRSSRRDRVRIQIGAMVFTPDFATVDKEYIGPGQSAIGYVFFQKASLQSEPALRPGLEPTIENILEAQESIGDK